MENRLERTSEGKDALIQRANKLALKKGFSPLKDARHFSETYLKEVIKSMSTQNDFTSKDKIVLHFNKPEMSPRAQFSEHIATHKFPTKSVAHFFIREVIKISEERVPSPSRKWKGPNRLCINEWIVITSDGAELEDIMEATVPKSYKLPHPYNDYAAAISNFRWGAHPQVNQQKDGAQYAPKKEETITGRTSHEKENKSNTPKRADKERSPTKKSGDAVSLAEICASLKIDTKEARGALRKINYPKPGASWEWSKDQETKVSADIKNAVEKARKK